MCSVSAILDYGRHIPTDRWTIEGIDQFNDLVKQAKKFDKVANEPDCEDPRKAEFMDILKEIRDRLERLEAQTLRNL